MAIFRGASSRMGAVANVKLKVAAAAGVLLLTGLWLALVQYNSTCTVQQQTGPSSFPNVVPRGDVAVAGKEFIAGAGGNDNAIQAANSIELSNLLKEAMKYGQVGKPTIHLVEVMEAMARPFFMFVCSNCFCDICDKVRLLGYWSPVESHIFLHVLRTHGCGSGSGQSRLVVDVGAHVGWFSLLSASYGCRVISFEPNVVALRYLNLSTTINDFHQVGLHPSGVGQADTKAEYRQTDTWALNGFLRRRSLLETLDVRKLDSVVNEDVLLLKIDTEGYEANVFAGAQKLLSQQKIQHILAEVKSASTAGKRSLLHSIFKTGGFKHVYNWDEVVTPLSVPFQQFGLQNATIVDVTEIVRDPMSYAPLMFQDFWFCKEPQLPWL